MQYGWMYGMGWGWILVFVVFGLLIWVAVRTGRSDGTGSTRPPRSSPDDLLKERLARGEIGEEEYRATLKVLHERT